MTLSEKAIRLLIDEIIAGKNGELYATLLKGREPHKEAQLRQRVEAEINAMSNVQLLDLLGRLTAAD